MSEPRDTMRDVNVMLAGIRRDAEIISTMLVGKQCIIQSSYNGQEFGSSRKSRKGDMMTIRESYIEGARRVTIYVDNERIGLGLDEVVIVEDAR